VHHPEDSDGVGTPAISHDIRRSADDKLARSSAPTGSPDFGESEQAGDSRHDTFNRSVGGRGIVAGAIGPCRGQIVHRGIWSRLSAFGRGQLVRASPRLDPRNHVRMGDDTARVGRADAGVDRRKLPFLDGHEVTHRLLNDP
jgi:hypothetical protein